MSRDRRIDLETRLPHAGQGGQDGEPLTPPIVQSTTFCRAGSSNSAK